MKRQHNDVTQPRFTDMLPEIIIQVIEWFDVHAIITFSKTSKACLVFLLTHVDLYAHVYNALNIKGILFQDPFGLWFHKHKKLHDFSVKSHVNAWYKLYYKAKLNGGGFTQNNEIIQFNTLALDLLKLLYFNARSIEDVSIEAFVTTIDQFDQNDYVPFPCIVYDKEEDNTKNFIITYDTRTFDITSVEHLTEPGLPDTTNTTLPKYEQSFVCISPMLYHRMTDPDYSAESIKQHLSRQMRWSDRGYYNTCYRKEYEIKKALYIFFKKYIMDDDELSSSISSSDDDSDD